MAKINENFLKLPGSYLFAEIARRTAAYQAANPDKTLIKMGIGDVTRPLAPSVIRAMHKAVDEMADAATFQGYGPYEGFDFLREAIAANDYAPLGVPMRNLCFRRRKERLRKHCGYFRSGQRGGCVRPGVPGVCGFQCHGRPGRGI